MTTDPIDIGLSERMQMFDHATHIEIIRRWFGKKYLLLTAFIVFWDGLLFFWYGMLPTNAPAMVILFPLLHVAVGVGLTYYVLTGWINRTYIYIGQGKLGVRHGPLPWPGNLGIETSDLKQLYAKANTSAFYQSFQLSILPAYEVRAVTKSGRNVRVVSGLATQEQAIFIEQKVDKYLGIEDMRVPGEIPKNRS